MMEDKKPEIPKSCSWCGTPLGEGSGPHCRNCDNEYENEIKGCCRDFEIAESENEDSQEIMIYGKCI